jgi:LacI family transcriptional regulator
MNITEIAALAGVSPATVSRVFSRNPGVSKDVARHVMEIAARHNYHPRISEKQKNVILITPYDSVYPVQSCVDMLLMALTQELPQSGFRVEILPLNSLERLPDVRFCAAAAVGIEPAELAGWDDRFSEPLIFLDRSPENGKPGKNVYFVNSDETGGMELALAHLKERGLRKVGCIIHGDPGKGNASAREKAVRGGLKKYGFPCDDNLVCFSGSGTERYVELVGKLLKLGADALFCPGGNAGITVLYALSLYGREVPRDISLIASEQTFFSSYAVPPQTTITQEYRLLASEVVSLITRRLDGKSVPPVTTLPYRLIRRESVR